MNELFKNDITLDQENHKYILNSSPEFKFSSVTEFIHFFFEKFDQEKVATKLINTNPKYSGKTLNEVLKEWGKGAERGTIVHNELEMYVKENIDPKHQMSITGVRWLKEKQKNEHNSFFSEVIVYSKELGIAGTVDCIAEYDNELAIIDFKTSKKPKPREWIEHYFVQAMAYGCMLYEMKGISIKKLVIIMACENGECVVYEEYDKSKYIKLLGEYIRKFVGDKLELYGT